MKKPIPDHLYVATDGKLFKIGITNAPGRRVGELGRGVRNIMVWHRTEKIVRDAESYVKTHFSDVQVRGEWFATTKDEILRVAARTIRINDDHLAMSLGREPSKRCDQPFVPPYKLPWLEQSHES